jgi:hypothetical protein
VNQYLPSIEGVILSAGVESIGMIDRDAIRARFEAVAPHLSERDKRLLAAAEALAAGWGGVLAVSEATGIARSTIGRGLKELGCEPLSSGRTRRVGAGPKFRVQTDPTLLSDLEQIVEPDVKGDPMRPLRWVSKSLAKIAAALQEKGHQVSANTVALLLTRIGYLRLVTRKSDERSTHPSRDAQFEHINAQCTEFLTADQPVISVDTKKKELIGNFKNSGSEYRPRGCPEEVRVHDFIDPDLGKAIPYGIYDVGANSGYVSVGVDHDTAQFAVNSIRAWWKTMGQLRYPKANRLMITADGGGSNGSRVRLWKVELQKFADETGLEICVCHYPPGCSKWNKVEHRLFCHITQNWRGTPLISRTAVVELIANTRTKTGLIVRSELDTRQYQAGIKVTDTQMATLSIEGSHFYPQWNYSIKPKEAVIAE